MILTAADLPILRHLSGHATAIGAFQAMCPGMDVRMRHVTLFALPALALGLTVLPVLAAEAHPSSTAISAVTTKTEPSHRLPRLKRLRRHR